MIGACAMVVLINTAFSTGGHLLHLFHLGLMGCTALALLAYWAFVRYGVRPLPTNRRLLVLRVFGAGRLVDCLEPTSRPSPAAALVPHASPPSAAGDAARPA